MERWHSFGGVDHWPSGLPGYVKRVWLLILIRSGESGVDQLVEIIKVLGTPSKEQIQQMNPNYKEFRFPSIRPHPWSKILRPGIPTECVDLVTKLLDYNPEGRLTPEQACQHTFFDELRISTDPKVRSAIDWNLVHIWTSLFLLCSLTLCIKCFNFQLVQIIYLLIKWRRHGQNEIVSWEDQTQYVAT